jgi:hypothetical protein
MKDFEKRISELEKSVDTKVDQNEFDNEIALIRSMIGNLDQDDKKKPITPKKGNLAPSTNSGFSAKEMDKIRDMLERVVQIEERMLKI